MNCWTNLIWLNVSYKILENQSDRVLFIITRSPEQYEDFDTTNEALDLDENKARRTLSDDLIDHKQKPNDPFFARRNYKDLVVFCVTILV